MKKKLHDCDQCQLPKDSISIAVRDTYVQTLDGTTIGAAGMRVATET
jgi:hypothetical protein